MKRILLVSALLLSVGTFASAGPGFKVKDVKEFAVFIFTYGYVTSVDAYEKEERSVVYYRKQNAPMFNSHPTDYEDVSKMLHKLLKDFIK